MPLPIYAFIQMAKTAALAVVVYVSSSHIHIGWEFRVKMLRGEVETDLL